MDLRSRIRAKKPTLGTWITTYHRSLVEIPCNAGLDWVCIDLEHSTIDLDQAGTLIAIARAKNVPALVRLSSNDPVQIKRVMDAGATGIIVPMINSKEEAMAAYGAMHYPPHGTRGVGISTAQDYGASFTQYKEWQKTSPILIVQIEHKKAVENLESILSLDEVDGYIVGPYDLSASLNIPGEFDHPDFLAIMEHLNKVTSSIARSSGIHVVEPDMEKVMAAKKAGHSFIAISFETRILDVFFRKAVQTFSNPG